MSTDEDVEFIARELNKRFSTYVKGIDLGEGKELLRELFFLHSDFTVERIKKHIRRSESRDRYYYLDEEFEEAIFRIIFELILTKPQKLYHYTNLNAAFSIIKSGKLQLSSIAGMNDKSELNFVDSLLKKRRFKYIYDQNKIEAYNRRFIMCFSRVEDHFNQWRLYGDDTKGVCLEFEVKLPDIRNTEIFLGNILYGKKLGSLINKLYKDLFAYGITFELKRLFLWKNFMKEKDYDYEKEVRMLMFGKDYKAILEPKDYKLNFYKIIVPYITYDIDNSNLPIKLKTIRLGGNCPENLMNKGQFQFMMERHTKAVYYKSVEVKLSKIEHYRNS